MHFPTLSTLSALLLTATLTASTAIKPAPFTITPSHRAKIIQNYIKLWGGDFTILNTTISPQTFNLYQDRFPNGAGTGSYLSEIHSQADMLAFIQRARSAFSQYDFIDMGHAGEELKIAIRWKLAAVYLGGFPGATLAPGSALSYNGTDFLTLDPCDGLITQVESAQDLINLFHILGIPVGIV